VMMLLVLLLMLALTLSLPCRPRAVRDGLCGLRSRRVRRYLRVLPSAAGRRVCGFLKSSMLLIPSVISHL